MKILLYNDKSGTYDSFLNIYLLMKTLKILISVPLDKRNFERFDIDIYLNFFDKIQIYHIHEGIDFKKDKIFNHRKIEILKVDHYFQLYCTYQSD